MEKLPSSDRFLPVEDALDVENESRPEKLYRGFVVDPESLSAELVERPLVMGLAHKRDSSKSRDGNEAGVYMSSNPTMVESTNYAHGAFGSLEVPRYAARGGLRDTIPLPGCGVIVEVETQGMDVRRPEISEAMQGHYNNGFEGDEWIADEVPADHYRVTKLTLSLGANDGEKIVLNVGDEPGALEAAIEEIKQQARENRSRAEAFKEFLESLTQEERYNENVVEKRWQAALEHGGPGIDPQENSPVPTGTGADEPVTDPDIEKRRKLARLRSELLAGTGNAGEISSERAGSAEQDAAFDAAAHLKVLQEEISEFFDSRIDRLLGQLSQEDLAVLRTTLNRERSHPTYGDLAGLTASRLASRAHEATAPERQDPEQIVALWRDFHRTYTEEFDSALPAEHVLGLDAASAEHRTDRLLELLSGMSVHGTSALPEYVRQTIKRAARH